MAITGRWRLGGFKASTVCWCSAGETLSGMTRALASSPTTSKAGMLLMDSSRVAAVRAMKSGRRRMDPPYNALDHAARMWDLRSKRHRCGAHFPDLELRPWRDEGLKEYI